MIDNCDILVGNPGKHVELNRCLLYTSRRAGDPAKLVANNTKAKEILGWEPKYTDIEKIISTAWNFYIGRK